jgi:hypothetical protein
MSFKLLITTDGETELVDFGSEKEFDKWYLRLREERWAFFKQLADLIEMKREELFRYGNFCETDESVTDLFINECRYWEAVYWRHLNGWDYEESDFEKVEKRLSWFSKSSFQYGKISNGDAGIHWKSVGEVFNWTCHICGEKVDRIGGTPTNRRGCTVEHIVPQSKGGANTWNNVLPAHWDCNLKKNANI